ncbi:MAG: hypothetical protein L3J79_08595 [Candidatus Marinimicrobia bacterium]|nr:hypothetical protein [Candidatus Neomarinimicrobiota bacterium]
MLEKKARRWLKITHIVFIASLVGGLLSIFMIIRLPGFAQRELFVINYSMYILFNGVVTFSFYGVICTGLIYSVFTHWALTKHWWIMAKWVRTLSVFALVWIWPGPAINGMTALSDAGLAPRSDQFLYHDYAGNIGPAILVVMVIFITLITITIFKPWGQRTQAYALGRGTILILTGSVVVVSIAFGIRGDYDLESDRNLEISSPDLTRIPDGVYRGSAGYAEFGYVVKAKVNKHHIENIEVR